MKKARRVKKSRRSGGSQRVDYRNVDNASEFAPEVVEKIAALVRLGAWMKPRQVSEALDLDEAKLTAWLNTPAGERVWRKARTEGRAELVRAIRDLAVAGDASAQKQLVALLKDDDGARTSELRLPAGDVRALVGRSGAKLRRRVLSGEFIDVGDDGAYGLAGLLALLPILWDRLAAARKQISHLERFTSADRSSEAEARRRLLAAQAARRECENSVAAGRLVERSQAVEEMQRLCDAVRTRVSEFVQDVRLGLSLDSDKSEQLEKWRRAYLERISRDMQVGEVNQTN